MTFSFEEDVIFDKYHDMVTIYFSKKSIVLTTISRNFDFDKNRGEMSGKKDIRERFSILRRIGQILRK